MLGVLLTVRRYRRDVFAATEAPRCYPTGPAEQCIRTNWWNS